MNGEVASTVPSPGASRPPFPPGGGRARGLPARAFGETMRADVWWTQPLLVFVGLSIFIVY